MFQRPEKSKFTRAPVEQAYRPIPATEVVFEAAPSVQANRFQDALVGIYGALGIGKAQPWCAIIQTPYGPRQMGSIRVGDEVCGADGLAKTVVGVYPRGTLPAFRVTFNDGSNTICSEDHLWSVWTRKTRASGRPPMTLSLREIRSRGANRFVFPLCAATIYRDDPHPLPIPPYSLGAFIGDGTNLGHTPTLCLSDEKLGILHRVSAELHWDAKQYRGPTCPRYAFSLGIGNKRQWLARAFRDMLLDVNSPSRHIPAAYLLSSVDNRILLLRGLMDTDGSVPGGKAGAIFSTISYTLAADVVTLVRSLGGIARQHRYVRDTGEVDFVVRVTTIFNPFYSGHKLANWMPNTRQFVRHITTIEDAGPMEQQCIKIDSPDGLYLTDDFIVTHNTTFLSKIPGIYMLPMEPGFLFKSVRKTRIGCWEDFRNFIKWAAKHPKAIASVKMWGIDTATALAKHCMYTACSEAGIRHPDDAGFGKGWEMFYDELSGWFMRLANLGKGIVFTAHERVKPAKSRGIEIDHYEPDLMGTAARALIHPAHILLHMSYTEDDSEDGAAGRTRCFYSRPSEERAAKDWTGRLPAMLPFKTEQIAAIKIINAYNQKKTDTE